MNDLARKGGIAASIVLILFGVAAVAVGFAARDTVRSDLAREQIVGTPDSSIPGQKVDTGSEAQAFAAVMRKHTLEATGGQTYAEMDRFLDASGKPTSDEAKAATDPKSGEPVENPARNIWISSTAFQTALNTAYFAESITHVRDGDRRRAAADRHRVPGADRAAAAHADRIRAGRDARRGGARCRLTRAAASGPATGRRPAPDLADPLEMTA